MGGQPAWGVVSSRTKAVDPPLSFTYLCVKEPRWRDAVCKLLSLQAAYADWLAALPDSLQGSSTAEALEAIVELDLTDLAGVEPPRGYGRD